MKKPHLHDYHREETARSEAALLTVWPRLADLHGDLVLVGGLVPRYLCREPGEGDWQPNTLDVDLAIALGAGGGGMYEPLSQRLDGAGFVRKAGWFEKALPGSGTLHLDLLTERVSEAAPTTAVVDDIGVNAFLGVDRALRVHRTVRITGRTLDSARVTESVKVCEVGPFLCLKLQAYAGRAERKDVFDVVHTFLHYDGGVEAAAAAFRAEAGANLALPIARRMLAERFSEEEAKGPTDYANFCLGEPGRSEDDTLEFRRRELMADAVNVARRLLVAIS